MDQEDSARSREVRFREFYEAAYVDLLRFVARRVDPTEAEDVVGEAMLVAWRRFDEVPAELSAARAWLFGVARKTLLNAKRREGKHRGIAVRLAEVRHVPTSDSLPDEVSLRLDLAAAWPLLSPLHQEAIALAVFDELAAPQAAAVLNISATAFRLRLSRARRALRQHLEATGAQPHVRGETPQMRSTP